MADVNEALIKEAIRRAEEKARLEKEKADAAAAADAADTADTAATAGTADTADAAGTADAADTADTAGTADAADTAGTADAADTAGTADTADTSDTADAADAEAEETSAEDEKATDGATDEGRKKINLFGKKDKKDKRDEQIADLNDRLLRNLAEFENFRKRTDKEKSQMFEMGAKSIVEKILPTIDNFERGLATVPEDKKEDPFVQGMEKIYKQMLSTLEEVGVKPIEAVGCEFDPNLHNAVMHVEDEGFGENTVCEEFQKGYMYRDSVVRHSMVKVAN